MYVLLTMQRWGCNYEPLMNIGIHICYNYVKKNRYDLSLLLQQVPSFNVQVVSRPLPPHYE